MKPFAGAEFEQYGNEAKERWGGTDAYREYQEKTKAYSRDKWQGVADGLNAVFAEFAACMNNGNAACSSAAQSLVGRLQNYISANCYNCTDEILAGLGQMYVLDERFRSNINRHGAGVAEFVRDAIEAYMHR